MKKSSLRGISDSEPDQHNSSLRRLKYADDTDFETLGDMTLMCEGTMIGKSIKIKLAAIYNDRKDVMDILASETSNDSVQKLLSMKDERGQPCIFYAIESRSKEVLESLMGVAKSTECLVATNGESVLHVVTKMGDVEILRSLLKLDIVAQLVDHADSENGRAPMHLAAKFNHLEIAKELLAHGARFDGEDTTRQTPIFIAASKGHASLLEVFLQHGRENIENLILDSGNCLYGEDYDNLLQVAVDSGDQKTVNVCLDQDSNIVRKCLDSEIKHGYGGLIHSACKNGMINCLLKMVDFMTDLESSQLNRKDKFGLTPIHKAALNNHAQIVRVISSISRSFVNQTTSNSQQTTLMLAVQAGHVEIVGDLIDLGADFLTCDASGRTVLHYAIDYPRILKMLLEIPELVRLLINKKEKDGYTPVHNAALKGLCQSLKILLEKGAVINVYTNKSRSPLHCAVSSQHVDVVQLVLSNGPALVNKTDATGKTALHTAASYGNTDIVKRLLDAGAILISDSNIYSPLHIASHKGHLEVVEMLVAFDKHIMDGENKYGRTALVEAAVTGKSDVVKFLLDNDSSVTGDYELLNCLDWCLIKNDRESAMTMMCHPRWVKILKTTRHGPEGTMTKLVYKMPEVAYRVLSNSMTSQGHPDSKEYVKRYDFLCLQNNSTAPKLKPMTAIKTMVRTECYSCLTHPVCCKFLKVKWMQFGWKFHFLGLLVHLTFLLALNVYAFGIPSHKDARAKDDDSAKVKVKMAMVFCLIFTSFNTIKEIVELIFYRHRYFLDSLNYLDCTLYLCAFIFAIPIDQKIAVKTSFQWEACSVALLLAWIKMVISLRTYASYGILILMMKRICVTLMKVLSLFIFFFVAFAAAFTPIMHGKPGFTNFGVSILTSAVMTVGELDYKETFLKNSDETFHWLRLALLVVFLVLMPIILMNLLLALAIDDTNNIRQQAKLRKHIQTTEMIIDLEQKRSLFSWVVRARMVSILEERPNKRVNFLRAMWENLFYGPDYSMDDGIASADEIKTTNGDPEQTHAVIVDMIKEVRQEMALLRQNLDKMQHGNTLNRKRLSEKDFRTISTQFRGYSVKDSSLEEIDKARTRRPDDKRQSCEEFRDAAPAILQEHSDLDGDVFSQPQDIEEKKSEREDNDPELIELKELHKKILTEEYGGVDGDIDDDQAEEMASSRSKHFQQFEETTDEDNCTNNIIV